MNPPPFEVADIIRQSGNSFIARNRSWCTWLHLRVLYAIEFCRTATLVATGIAVPDAAMRPSHSIPALWGVLPYGECGQPAADLPGP